ncbi:MAG: OsmC family protein [Dehalococcoidia bacterium]
MAETKAEELNGLHPAKLEEIIKSLEDPAVLKEVSGPWRSRVKWQGGFKAKAYTRNHTVDLDEPEGLDATDTAASAHEHILSAVGGCMTVGFVLNATRRGIKINDLEIALEGHFDNILKWAGLSDGGNPGYATINAKVFVNADADEKTLQEIWKLAVEGSPVTQTVSRSTQIIPEFEVV